MVLAGAAVGTLVGGETRIRQARGVVGRTCAGGLNNDNGGDYGNN